MNEEVAISRRRFLQSAGTAASATLLRAGSPALAAIVQAACTARDEAATMRNLDPVEQVEYAAIAARIIPTTDTPGATEAGVIYFWDQALGARLASFRAPSRALLDELVERVGRRFSDLTEAEQDEALRAVETDGRFMLWRDLTMFGFFAMSRYGGNRDHVGWDLIGFEGHRGAWAPPFGHYDAAYNGVGGDDE